MPDEEEDMTYSEPEVRRRRPARAHKAALVVAQDIVEDISRRKLGPGSRLATEKEMLVMHGVGRGTLRESLRFLELNGVISMKPGPRGGPTVEEPDSKDLAGTLGLFLQVYNTPFKAIVESREYLEPIMAGLAATNSSSKMLSEIADSLEEMKSNIDDEERFLEANEKFHESVAWASGNTVFALFLCSLHWITDGTQLGVDYPLSRRKAVLLAHQTIYKAISARDSALASKAMKQHVSEFRKYIEKNYSSVFDRPLRWGDIAP